MSDLVIFVVGTGVFAVTTTATLLYGYMTFQERARQQGVLVADASAEVSDVQVDIALIAPAAAAERG